MPAFAGIRNGPPERKKDLTMLRAGYSLRIFVGEQDKHDGMPLYEWIIQKAQHEHLAGTTIIRGVESFGVHHQIHTSKMLQLSSNLPMIIEIIDTVDKVKKFMELVEKVMQNGLITLQPLEIQSYRSQEAN